MVGDVLSGAFQGPFWFVLQVSASDSAAKAFEPLGPSGNSLFSAVL